MKKERGFTLIELLVVIAILAVLFGLTALYLSNVGRDAEAVTMQAEKDMVQTAIDVCVAQGCTISNQTTATRVGPGTNPFGVYLRRTSKYCYTWDNTGTVLSVVGNCQ